MIPGGNNLIRVDEAIFQVDKWNSSVADTLQALIDYLNQDDLEVFYNWNFGPVSAPKYVFDATTAAKIALGLLGFGIRNVGRPSGITIRMGAGQDYPTVVVKFPEKPTYEDLIPLFALPQDSARVVTKATRTVRKNARTGKDEP